MPVYTFRDKETKEEYDLFLTISEREKYLSENPHIEQCLAAPPQGDPIKLGVRKGDPRMNEILKNIKKHHHGSNIQIYD